jgi:hypothetical protein
LKQITVASSLALRSGRLGSPAVAGPLIRSPLAVWAAIWMNVLAFVGQAPIIPIPGFVGQAITQGALVLALFLALLVNPAVVIRPNLVLILLSTMALFAFLASLHSEFFIGSTYRGIRLMMFVTVLWLLTPWWGRPDLPLLWAHIKILRVVVGSVIVGAIAWGPAHIGGRLQGTLWPVPPPQVAHYAAVLVGCTAVLWFTGHAGRRAMLFTLLAGGYALIDSHTRTALAGLLLGLIVAGSSLFLGHARVRRTAATMTVFTGFVVALFAPYLVAWLSRGQSSEDAAQLTGRTKVWSKLISEQRSHLHLVFGDGLSNKSFDGLPIDSSWVATYLDQGLFGAGLIVAFLLVLLMTALTRPRGPGRAIALFLVTYCIVASFTETGLGDASPYLLDICVAASVLALPTRERAT